MDPFQTFKTFKPTAKTRSETTIGVRSETQTGEISKSQDERKIYDRDDPKASDKKKTARTPRFSRRHLNEKVEKFAEFAGDAKDKVLFLLNRKSTIKDLREMQKMFETSEESVTEPLSRHTLESLPQPHKEKQSSSIVSPPMPKETPGERVDS